jgi:hypothetical protein
VEMAIKNNTFSGREKAYLRNKCQISKKKQRDKIIWTLYLLHFSPQ